MLSEQCSTYNTVGRILKKIRNPLHITLRHLSRKDGYGNETIADAAEKLSLKLYVCFATFHLEIADAQCITTVSQIMKNEFWKVL